MGRPVIGVALGSGGARGFAHIGVLKAFEEYHIPIDVVAGCSMGSLIGAFYATGMKPEFMAKLAPQIRRRHWLDLGIPKLGIVAGERVRDFVHLMTRGLRIDQTEKPFAIVATDLLTRQNVMFMHETISDAVRASVSIPGVFVPYTWNGGVYVDGGVLNPVPVDAAKRLGAEVVIGVDVGSNAAVSPPQTMVEVILQSFEIMQEYVSRGSLHKPTVSIEPNLDGIGISHFHRAREAIEAGYAAAMAEMDRVKQFI